MNTEVSFLVIFSKERDGSASQEVEQWHTEKRDSRVLIERGFIW